MLCPNLRATLAMNIDLAAQKSLDRLNEGGIAALSETDKVLATVWQFAAGVGNGGFIGYFTSRRGGLAFHAPAALRTIGAMQLAEIATEANAIFGANGPPADRAARLGWIDNLPEAGRHILDDLDKRYFGCNEDVDQLLEMFVNANRRKP